MEKGEKVKALKKESLITSLKKSGRILLITSLALGLSSCEEEEETEVCSDAFIQSYKSMKTEFQKLYSQSAGATELESFRSSLDSFLASHADVECEDSSGKSYAPTADVKAFSEALPKFYGASLASIVSSVTSTSKSLTAKVVYGVDDRVEVSEAPAQYQDWAASTAAMMSSSEWDADYNIISDTIGESMRLCPDQRFYDQFSSATCSGFLVGPDTLVTAGHCVSEASCANYSWVFGFTSDVTKLDPENIYECKEVVKSVLTEDGEDYAVVTLDRKVTGRKFFRPRTSGAISKGAGIVVIGHPSGLPTKIADGATVRDSSNSNYFVTDLDTFGGNSGSVVINQTSGMAEGILVRGDTDYNVITYSDGSRCRTVNFCDQDGCGGEEVTKLSIVEGLPTVASFDEVYAGIFEEKTYPEINEGLPIPFNGSSFGDYTIGGVKFLDQCGIHFYKSAQPSVWSQSFVGSCSSNDLASVVSSFSNLFYF